jgi:hypothetical protein
MHTSRVTKLGGIGALIGGGIWLLTLLLTQVVSRDLEAILPIALVLLVLGVIGMQARHAGRMGALGAAGLGISLIGAALLAFGSVGDAVITPRILGTALAPVTVGGLAPGAFVFGVGVTLSALGAIIADVLPRLSPIALLVGALGVATAGGLTLANEFASGTSADILPFEIGVLVVLWAVFGLAWMWIGLLLWSERLPPDIVR